MPPNLSLAQAFAVPGVPTAVTLPPLNVNVSDSEAQAPAAGTRGSHQKWSHPENGRQVAILAHSVAGTLNRAHRPPPFDHSS